MNRSSGCEASRAGNRRACERHAAALVGVLLFAALGASAQTAVPPRPGANPDADARAYRAFVAGNEADLARARSESGNAARYAKENPNAIFDAMSDERSVDILEFVLKSGADPNTQRSPTQKGTPLSANLHDGDKIALLLKHGADVNARDFGGYTPLAHALFDPAREYSVPRAPRPGQPARVFTKVEIVRLLLDAGAQINGNVGGWGRDGALGLVRHEDPDVLTLMIERGATFTDAGRQLPTGGMESSNRGPITIAVQLDRDDIALALLRRDRKLTANDNLALLEAARRGFSDVAIAILEIGADPNVADAHGATALAWATRRKDSALIAALQNAGATSPAKPVKPAFNAATLNPFELAAANEIDGVALFDPGRFSLSWSVPRREVAFAFPGNSPGQYETIKCEQSAGFSFVARSNDQGAISVGVCTREARRVRDAVNWARVALEQMLGTLAGSGARRDAIKQLGWEWRDHEPLGKLHAYTFPVIWIGHGIGWVDTVVVFNAGNDRAVIVQADLQRLCEPTRGIQTRLRTPLCEATADALTRITMEVAKRN